MDRGSFLYRVRKFPFPLGALSSALPLFFFGTAQDSLQCALEGEGAGRVFSVWFQIVNK